MMNRAPAPSTSGRREPLQTRSRCTVRSRHIVLVARNASNNSVNNGSGGESERQISKPSTLAEPSTLDIAYESESAALLAGTIKTTGLHRAPLTGGVKTATLRYNLPKPAVGVRNLVEMARFGHLCSTMSGMHHRRAGYPFGTLIDLAADGAGYPIFCLSPLAIHSRNIMEDPRCSLVVQMPGWTGLANARVTIFGDIYQLPTELQSSARDIFFAKHASDRKERWLSGNFVYFRMNRIVDIYFVGGFGTVQWISPEEYLTSRPDNIVLDDPTKTMKVLNEAFADELMNLILLPSGEKITEALFISIDANGADIRLRTATDFHVERIGFPNRVGNLQEAVESVKAVVTSMKQSRLLPLPTKRSKADATQRGGHSRI
ncbi:hypothetical protein CEUSTIGMA_g8646.t1 [Chlamydomonas eustigma]|uniref:CREG-like beta-barrel domain-containing protein n=1 Tax=Chlamydomonas eustigma TaxID=1157962 RepID=A0A250XDS7_9CHLO|nr:hypothetical protein CEUSTIGMA_g8646.t1 [Chlamydomonas eustigma]|eukprot:GAX81214.1 hypothetical protein CEUSTIGMA_g8646.t1 [Chlamydomonas eustigma]